MKGFIALALILCMLLAFVGYLRIFIEVSRGEKPASSEPEKG